MYGADRRDRWRGAAGAALLVAAIGYGLVAGLDVRFARVIGDELKVVAILPETQPPPPPVPPPAPKRAAPHKEGAAAPPNLKARATELVAPPPVLAVRQPPPVAVANVAGLGGDPSAGAAPVAGPGTGAGGIGNGTGSGGAGDGDGGGGGTLATLVRNDLRYRDLPRDLRERLEDGQHRHLRVEYAARIGIDGRLGNCRVLRSSGDRALDEATCALALRDVRFRPARDAAGRRVVDDGATFEQRWDVDSYAPGDPDDPRDRDE